MLQIQNMTLLFKRPTKEILAIRNRDCIILFESFLIEKKLNFYLINITKNFQMMLSRLYCRMAKQMTLLLYYILVLYFKIPKKVLVYFQSIYTFLICINTSNYMNLSLVSIPISQSLNYSNFMRLLLSSFLIISSSNT